MVHKNIDALRQRAGAACNQLTIYIRSVCRNGNTREYKVFRVPVVDQYYTYFEINAHKHTHSIFQCRSERTVYTRSYQHLLFCKLLKSISFSLIHSRRHVGCAFSVNVIGLWCALKSENLLAKPNRENIQEKGNRTKIPFQHNRLLPIKINSFFLTQNFTDLFPNPYILISILAHTLWPVVYWWGCIFYWNVSFIIWKRYASDSFPPKWKFIA